MQEKRRVFILGAGFSKQVGMPLATELIELLIQKFREDDVDEALEWFDSIVKRIKRLTGTKTINIEELFHYAQYEIELCKMDQHLAVVGREYGITPWNNAEGIESWLQYMEDDLIDVILEKQDQSKHIELIDNFVKYLGMNDNIISFNYDLLVEDALNKRKQPWNHGLNDFKREEIVILKMHGSLDWIILDRGETEKFKKFIPLFQKQDKNREIEINEKPLGEREYDYELARIEREALNEWLENRILQRGSWKSVGMAGLGSYKPLHRLPGSGMIWARARGYLAHADEIIIIGFSFSSFDVMVRLCFCEAMEVGKPKQRIIVIDPNAENNEYKSVIQNIFGDNINFIKAKAEEIKWDSLAN